MTPDEIASNEDKFECAILRIERRNSAWKIWLSCGHEANYRIWPASPTQLCLECYQAAAK